MTRFKLGDHVVIQGTSFHGMRGYVYAIEKMKKPLGRGHYTGITVFNHPGQPGYPVIVEASDLKRDAGRTSNPGRPPKAWMKRCVAGVKAGGSAYDPGAVCGAQWHRKMSPAQKRAAVRKERRGNPTVENPYARFSNPHGGES